MDYEKKKTEALEKLMQCVRFDIEPAKTILKLFPELEESDYVIKQKLKHLLGYFRSRGIDHDLCDRILKWLEKQDEQNPANKVEPWFRVGDWIVFNNDHDSIYQVENKENYEYTLRHFLGGSMNLSFSHGDMIRAWTIQDAKDGDVLAFNNGHIILVKESRNSTWGWRLSCWCHLLEGKFEVVEYHTKIEGLHPATKGQRELLFTKMKEAGYEWNADEKELKKIE